MRRPDATAIAIGVGLIALLLGYLLPSAFGSVPQLVELRTTILGIAVILAAVATLVAIFSLVSVHWRKLRARRAPDRYSAFTLLAFVITFVVGIAAYSLQLFIPEYQQVVVNAIQMPIEASLMAVLAVTLSMAAFRIFQRRQGLLAIVFVVSVLLFLLLNSGVTAILEPILPDDFLGPVLGIVQILPVAGGRGILLGIALGSIMAGLRVLFGAERPYSG
jgi:hypothetical protein